MFVKVPNQCKQTKKYKIKEKRKSKKIREKDKERVESLTYKVIYQKS